MPPDRLPADTLLTERPTLSSALSGRDEVIKLHSLNKLDAAIPTKYILTLPGTGMRVQDNMHR